jgi:phosphoribosylaminoimidazole-succinocarboxamide synthase
VRGNIQDVQPLRFWLAAEWQLGRPQRSLDKQFLRDWSVGLDWDRRPPGPVMPPEIVAATRVRYQELYARLTSADFDE